MSDPTLRVLSLGAGVQSTTLLLLAAEGRIGPLDAAIFADTNRHIQPGERYNEGVAAPNDNDLGNEGWWRLAECFRCAERYGRPIPPADPTSPPYWPYRCAACARFVSNPQVQLGADPNPWAVVRIVAETGDCKKCGPQVPLCRLGWDDWFADDYDPTALAALGAAS